jgi:hypothetical protein
MNIKNLAPAPVPIIKLKGTERLIFIDCKKIENQN